MKCGRASVMANVRSRGDSAVASSCDGRYTELMLLGTRQYLILGLLAVAAGCATSVIPESLEPQVDKAVTFSQVLEAPDSYRGKVVVWAGEVLKAKAMKGGTQLEVLQLPLDDEQGPVTDRMESKGRSLAPWRLERRRSLPRGDPFRRRHGPHLPPRRSAAIPR